MIRNIIKRTLSSNKGITSLENHIQNFPLKTKFDKYNKTHLHSVTTEAYFMKWGTVIYV